MMLSDKPQFWSASAYLPNLLALQVAMKDDTLVSVLGSGEDRKVKQKLTHAELHPAAQRLRIKCRDEIEKNYRHTKECEPLLRMCTACDPRWRLRLFVDGLHAEIKAALVQHTVKFHEARRGWSQPWRRLQLRKDHVC